VMGQCFQWRQQAEPGVAVVGAATEEYHSMTRAVAVVVAVEAVQWMKGVKTLGEGRRIEVLVEEVGLHDTVDVRKAVEVVGCSGERGVDAVQVRESAPKWEQK